MNKRLADKEHLVRVAGLFLGGFLLFLVIQQLLVPSGFGVLGHYREGALADNRQRTPVHAGQAACVECHASEAAQRKAGKHARVGCEACHGALGEHAAAPTKLKPKRPHGRAQCEICHTANVAKPEKFPQVEPAEHAGESLCIECHSPHNPGTTPEAKS